MVTDVTLGSHCPRCTPKLYIRQVIAFEPAHKVLLSFALKYNLSMEYTIHAAQIYDQHLYHSPNWYC